MITGLRCVFSIYYTVIGSIDTSVRGRRSHGSVHTQISESRSSGVRRENHSKCIKKHLFSFIWNKQRFKCHKCRAMLSHHPDCVHCTLCIFFFFLQRLRKPNCSKTVDLESTGRSSCSFISFVLVMLGLTRQFQWDQNHAKTRGGKQETHTVSECRTLCSEPLVCSVQ